MLRSPAKEFGEFEPGYVEAVLSELPAHKSKKRLQEDGDLTSCLLHKRELSERSDFRDLNQKIRKRLWTAKRSNGACDISFASNHVCVVPVKVQLFVTMIIEMIIRTFDNVICLGCVPEPHCGGVQEEARGEQGIW